jgi:CubicO group peptidase (beta-lactamase class C family)
VNDLAEVYDRPDRGVAAVVRHQDGTVTSVVRGHARPGEPFTADTVSYAASVSKQMAGVCAALLDVDAEASVRHWLPELPAWADGVRLRHLLHHIGGLPGDAELASRMPFAWDTPSVLRALEECPAPRFPPGTEHEYNNAGYICLVAVLERVTGTPFTDLAQRLLFVPLDMRRTRFHADAVPPDAAPATPDDPDPAPAPLSLGDGGAWTTAEDLRRWNDALMPGGHFDERVRTLVHTPGHLDDGTPLHYGWGIGVTRRDGVLRHGHAGSWPGWTARVVRLPEVGVSVAAVANGGSVPAFVELTDRLLDDARRGPSAR